MIVIHFPLRFDAGFVAENWWPWLCTFLNKIFKHIIYAIGVYMCTMALKEIESSNSNLPKWISQYKDNESIKIKSGKFRNLVS